MVDPSAPRRSIFAVWCWPRWVWYVIVPMMLMAYFLSPEPIGWLLFYCQIHHPNNSLKHVVLVVDTFYFPADWIAERNSTLSAIYQWELEMMNWLFDEQFQH
jgi:hypothetical protein